MATLILTGNKRIDMEEKSINLEKDNTEKYLEKEKMEEQQSNDASEEEQVSKNVNEHWTNVIDLGKDCEERTVIINQYRDVYMTNNSGVMVKDNASVQEINFSQVLNKNSKESECTVVENSEHLRQWILHNYYTMGVPYLISCAVFYNMPYMWICEAAKALSLLLYSTENNVEKRIFSQQDIKEFGAEIYRADINTGSGKSKMDFVRFLKSSYPDIIMKCIWNQFPEMREVITNWLKRCMLFNKKIMFRRVNDVLSMLAQEDYYYFVNYIVQQLYDEKDIHADMGLTRIILSLYEAENHKENSKKLVNQWSERKEVHHLLTVMLICNERVEQKTNLNKAIHNYLDGLFRSILRNRENDFSRRMYDFFAIGMRNFTFYRIIIEEIYEFAKLQKTQKEAVKLFLLLFSCDVTLAKITKEEAIFVKLVYSNSVIRTKLCELWRMAWNKHAFREIFYLELGRCFVNRGDDRECEIERFIASAFFELESEYKEDLEIKIVQQCRRLDKNEQIYKKEGKF
ncbi:MAG: hypothetical protein J1F02_06315 [Lachnospiraceae bacterium]|nr:hypothetical protein [Lachnospiraceae bacterium]